MKRGAQLALMSGNAHKMHERSLLKGIILTNPIFLWLIIGCMSESLLILEFFEPTT